MSNTDDWFREWFNSPYYHTLYFDRNEQEAAAFIHRLIARLQPPPGSRMLDLACGKGRHARVLAEKGFDTTGIDLATDSIAYARRFENDHLHFYVHDMRHPFRINYFDYVFNLFTSFGYFRTEREHDNTVRAIRQALKKDGTLVLDYLNVPYAEEHLVRRSEKKIEGITFRLTKWFDRTHFYKKILIEDQRLAAPLEYTERLVKFSPEGFRDLFARHGLQIRETFGDYDLSPFDLHASPRLLMIAQKTG